MSSIFRITDPILSDSSIDKYEEFEYGTIAGTNLNSFGSDIRLTIQNQDIFMHPSKSFLIIEGQLVRNVDGNDYAASDLITLTNNGIMHLFKRIQYDLSGHVIENLQFPGQATTMLGLLKYPDDFSKSKGLNQLWYKDTTVDANNNNAGFSIRRSYIIVNADPRGTFSFKIPLKHIFGFCEDYDKVVYGFQHNLTLTRNNDNEGIFKTDNVDLAGNDAVVDGKVILSKIAWFMPHVEPADKDKMELYKIIERKEKIPVGYRMIQCDNAQIPQNSTTFIWRLSVKSSPEIPRFIIVGFQTNKRENQKTNPSLFNTVDVSSMSVTLNATKYPAVDYSISFDRQQFSRAYGDVADFRSKFFNMDELVSSPNINPSDYRALYPLFLYDVSKQSEKLKYSTTDIHIRMNFNVGIPANTEAYAVIISDRLINFQSDGNKFSVVF